MTPAESLARTRLALAGAAVSLLALAGCGRNGQGMMAPPPMEVTVAQAEAGSLPLQLEYSARVAGSREVEVRARVSGILLERRYQEGKPVRQGDVLFVIDPEQYRATAAQARAELGVERARLDEARRQRDRILPLFEKNAVSQRQRDEAVSQFEVAQANVAAAEAKVRTAELNLGYTEVRAPISGLTSREVRSEGSLVTAGAETSLLTHIVQTDPAYVEFAMPDGEASALRSRLAGRGPPVAVKLVLEDGTEYPETAKLGFLDTTVEQRTGTVRARGVVANKDGQLVPGQFVRVRVEGVTLSGTVAVPSRAVMSSAQGTFVWVVGPDDTVQLRPVVLGGNVGDRSVIRSGLQGNERVVVEGVLKVQPGAKVTVAKPAATPPGAPPAGKAG